MGLKLPKLNLGNLIKVIGVVDAIKTLKGKGVREGVSDVEDALGLDILDEARLEQWVRDAQAWLSEGEQLFIQGQQLVKDAQRKVEDVLR